MKVYIIILMLLIVSCNNDTKKNIFSIRKNNMVLKGYVINDSIFNDTVYYYNFSGKLLRKDKFSNGKLNGVSIDYHFNGKPRMVSYYSNGLKNGTNSYFDTAGICYYKDYYYYDLPVGPIIYFNKDGSPKSYFFINIQNETLFNINYKNWDGINKVDMKCINFTANSQRVDSTHKIFLLLYLLNPPKFSFEYTIVKKKRNSENGFVKLFMITNDFPFKNLILPELLNDENYAIQLNIYDSLLNKRNVIFKDID
jgi:hypothetical protein